MKRTEKDGSEEMQKVIKDYLDNLAKIDKLFAEKYNNPQKTVKECCQYIIAGVYASGYRGLERKEVFASAVHYYEEENIEVGKAIPCHVVVNRFVEPTAEEKQKAKLAALNRIQQEEYQKLNKRKRIRNPKTKEPDKVQTQTLF